MLNSERSALQVLFVPQRAQKYHLNAVFQYSGSSPCLHSLRVSPQAGPTEGQGAAREVKTNTSKGDRSVVLTTLTFLRSVGFGVVFFSLSRLLYFTGSLLNYRDITQASFIHPSVRDPGEHYISLRFRRGIRLPSTER
ncbi:uncharacterized protein WM294_013259 [Sarcoramphus papa]